MNETLSVDSIWRYPVKGLGGERLSAAEISAARGICGDRRWMMTTADVAPMLSGQKQWRPWNYGPSLKRNPRLSALCASLHNGELIIRVRNAVHSASAVNVRGDSSAQAFRDFDANAQNVSKTKSRNDSDAKVCDDSQENNFANSAIDALESRGDDSEHEVRGEPETKDGRRRIEIFLRKFFADDAIILADCDSRPAWDYDSAAPLTALFMETVSDLSQRIGATLSAERFRANIVLRGGAATDERNRIGEELHIGEKTILAAKEGVERCAATRVNPDTGGRDINIPEMLMRHYQCNEMGIKCIVRSGGTIAENDNAFWR